MKIDSLLYPYASGYTISPVTSISAMNPWNAKQNESGKKQTVTESLEPTTSTSLQESSPSSFQCIMNSVSLPVSAEYSSSQDTFMTPKKQKQICSTYAQWTYAEYYS